MEQKHFQLSKHDDIFAIVKDKEKFIICVGEYKAVNKEFETVKDAETYIGTKPYKLIFNTFQILQNYAKKENTKQNETISQGNM